MNLSIVIQQHIKPLIMVSYVELAMSYRLSSQQTTTSTIITYQIVKELPITRSELKPLNRSSYFLSNRFSYERVSSFRSNLLRRLVELSRIELLTSCVQGRRSPSWAIAPYRVLKHTNGNWWVWADLNCRPHAYQACALTTWATDPFCFVSKTMLRST